MVPLQDLLLILKVCYLIANLDNSVGEKPSGEQDSLWDKIGILYNRDNYSTTEQVIGTWIDGKPLYRKVATVSAITGNNTWKSVDNAPTNVRTYINAYGYLFNQQTGVCTYKVPFAQPNNLQYAVCLHSNQYLAGTGVDGLGMFIVYEYTKTTD